MNPPDVRNERATKPTSSPQPTPSGPLPAPELYVSVRLGVSPATPGGTAIGTASTAAPVKRSEWNISALNPALGLAGAGACASATTAVTRTAARAASNGRT